MAPHIPSGMIQLLGEVSEKNLAEVFRILKIDKTPIFKKFCAKNAGGAVCHEFLFFLSSADRAGVAILYKNIEGLLFVGGCAPGLGIAFNVVDAFFCFLLANWFGFVVAIISCFPIPGFKLAGKGVEKLLAAAIKRIPVGKISSSLIAALRKRLGLMKNFVCDQPYLAIQKALKEYLPQLSNPFADEVARELNKIVTQFGPRLQEKTISNATHMTQGPSLGSILMKTRNIP